MAEQLPLAAYFTTDAERLRAEEVLDQAQTFNGVVQGVGSAGSVSELSSAGLVVEALSEAPESPPELTMDVTIVPDLPHDMVRGGGGISAGGGAGVGSGAGAGMREMPAGVDFGPVTARARRSLSPPGAYRVRLNGPITAEQRQTFAELRIDLEAFEPPDGYRVRLRTGQVEQVSLIEGVIAIESYRPDEAVTPGLEALLERAERPRLATAEPEVATFDCFVQSPRDLPSLASWLDTQPGVDVTGRSNQRLRIAAPVDPVLLHDITAREEVRKLTPYTPPKI